MTDEQYEALGKYVKTDGTPLEKAMLHQINVMVIGVEAASRTRKQYEKLYTEAETDLREVRLALRKVHKLLSATNSKTAKPKLLEMVQQALDELDVFEVTESAE